MLMQVIIGNNQQVLLLFCNRIEVNKPKAGNRHILDAWAVGYSHHAVIYRQYWNIILYYAFSLTV